jgi:hypothetical protein
MVDGADDEEIETKDRHGAEGENCLGSSAGALDDCRFGPTLSGSPEPDLFVEEAIAGAGGTGILTLAWEWMRGNERSGRSRNSTPRSGSLPSSEIFYARGQDDEQAGPRSFAQPKPCRSIDPPAAGAHEWLQPVQRLLALGGSFSLLDESKHLVKAKQVNWMNQHIQHQGRIGWTEISVPE